MRCVNLCSVNNVGNNLVLFFFISLKCSNFAVVNIIKLNN